MAAVDFKFRADAPADAVAHAAASLGHLGVEARPLFSGEEDPELRLMWVVECEAERAVEVVRALEGEAGVEYAEVRPVRGLIR